MKQLGYGSATGIRALECSIAAMAALFASDSIRATLAPVWAALQLLFCF